MIDVGKLLNSLIEDCLYSSVGDPDYYHQLAAARAFVVLKQLNLPVDDEKEILVQLRKDNLYEFDFLAEAGWPPSMDEQ